MKKEAKISCAKVAVVLAAIPVILLGYETGPPAGYTAAPGDNATSCIASGCHVGTLNSGPGNVTITAGSGATYTPGQAMKILVKITDATKAAYGFQMTARMGSGNNTQAGDFTTLDANTQTVCFDGPKANGKTCSATFPQEYAEHSTAGYTSSLNAPGGTYTYSFNWTPPATGSGPVTLYASANCGPAGQPVASPTNVYTTKITLAEASNAKTPSISSGGIGPIYSKATSIQPGSWISIYGTNLVSSLGIWDGNPPTPTTLGGASVTINGKPAYLWVTVPNAFGTTDQINAQAPDDTGTGTVNVTVTNATNGSASSTVTLANVAPSFSVLGDAANHAAAIIPTPDGSGSHGSYDIDGPAGTSLGYATRPVKAGEYIVLYGVGFGPTNPAVQSGKPVTTAAPLTTAAQNSLQITIGGVPVPASNITYAAIVGQGLYQFNVLVPPGLGSGDKTLQATVLGVSTPTGVVLALQ